MLDEKTAPAVTDSRATSRPEPTPKPELFVIVLVGDTGLNAHAMPVNPTKARRHGRGYPWEFTTRGIKDLIDGHINFANIETVVTEDNRLRPGGKRFTFKMHPNGARHLVDIGFNVFSLANNHTADYGVGGIRDSIRHTEALRTSGLRAHAGLGLDRARAIQPDIFTVGRARFAFSAMGIGARQPGTARAGEKKPGQVNIYGERDYNSVVDALASAPADFRILSMHFGAERSVRPLPGQVRKWRDATQYDRDIDLIVGHHAHVVQGVQMNRGKLIFYGLGNFLHMGMQDMGKFNACRDYGLLARVFVVRQPNGSFETKAVQAVPLIDMHLNARPITGKRGHQRIEILNELARELDAPESGSRGVRFTPQSDGSGLFCTPDAANGPGRLAALCKGYTPPPEISAARKRRIRQMCASAPRVAKARKTPRKRAQRKRKVWDGRSAFSRN
ncbi:MAG: CapA family protein [Pseudomonadota bacterium]